ncbi:MAG: hypothetical protein K2M63_02450 [Muribaculaceae bacterium]|nr:hypothetical protein [Muribaculaceae bacterium]
MKPSVLRFVQRDYPKNSGEKYDVCYIYSCFITFLNIKNGKKSRLKYIIRAEKYQDVFAIKFYASRDRKSVYDKYSLGHNDISITGIRQIFEFCIDVLLEILELFPGSSFVVLGADSYNPKTQKTESSIENQRFRIYRLFLNRRIGSETFHHFQHPSISLYLLTYKDGKNDKEKSYHQIKMLLDKFELKYEE